MSTHADRQVHARFRDGREVVRYDRAGRWYLEHPATSEVRRTALKIKEAAAFAIEAHGDGGAIFTRMPGGGQFDVLVRALTSPSRASDPSTQEPR